MTVPAEDQVLRALADPTRRSMLRLVRSQELAAGQIASHFPISQQAVSQHLQVLHRAGLVEERREGTRRLYVLRPDSLGPVRALLDDLWPDALEWVEEPRRTGQEEPIMTADLVVTTTIDATPEEVFPYLVEADLLVRWLAPWVDVDPRPGGAFAVDMPQTPVRGTYLVVDPPHRVVFTWGIPGSAELPAGSTTVDITLRAKGDSTLVELTHRDLPTDQQPGHQQGWTRLLGVLVSAQPGGSGS